MPNVQEILFLKWTFTAVFAILTLLCILAFVYCIKEKRFTDKIVAVNMINTLAMNFMCMLSLWLMEDFILDIAIVYAVLGFLAIIVLCRQLEKERIERGEDK